jgi:hypothetical protein
MFNEFFIASRAINSLMVFNQLLKKQSSDVIDCDVTDDSSLNLASPSKHSTLRLNSIQKEARGQLLSLPLINSLLYYQKTLVK